MRRMASAVLALAAALCLFLFTASVAGAQAPAATIDAEGNVWQPPNVRVTTGETVRWTFEGETVPHNVKSASDNWNVDTDFQTGGAPFEHTFTAPGVYSFLCEAHPGTMTGTVTVEDPEADPLENVLVYYEAAGFAHTSRDEGVAAIQALGAANDFQVTASEDSSVFTAANLAQYDAVVFLSTTGDALTDEQQDAFEEYFRAGGGFVGIHSATDTEYGWSWYGEMIGGYFRNHPPGTPQANVIIEDGDEPSTEGLPSPWTRIDEWYNFQSPVNPVVNGGGDDYSPRESGVKVLATVDESTYDEQDGNTTDDDHPVTWCSDFDGGRMWYTALGHTEASFGTGAGNIRSHILGGLQTVTGAEPADCGEPRQASPEPSDFEMVTIDDDTESPMELAVADDGRVFYVERITGELNVYNPVNGQVTTAVTLAVSSVQENGLIGIALDPNFETNNHLYVTYTPPTPNDQTRVSRFTVGPGNTIDPASEQIIFTWIAQRQQCCHSGGSLAFAPNGDLYISTGDNTNPFASDGFSPIDERPGREFWDAQRTSANSNNHNGKILRIHPLPNATGVPGIGSTYSIPAGNMFDESEDTANETLPEIFAMGFRNPFRITVDPHTGWVLVGNYGPDAGATDPNRGPQGSVEFEVVKEPGFYGWPYCVRDNVPYNDFNFANGTSGPKFDCANLTNDSPNNTGIEDLPPAIPATMWLGYSETDPRVPDLGPGGAPTGGPRYQFDPDLESATKFPEYYDGHWFIGEWNSGWLRTATLDDEGNALGVFRTPWEDTFFRPHEIEFGPDGALYVIDWGSGFNGNNVNSGIYRIDYIAGERRPIARATSNTDNGPVPLTVNFSSAGSIDPDGTSLTYAWDFDGDGDTDSTEANPTHTYTTPGTFNATLTVTDGSGDKGFDTIPITAGNTRPTVTITIPTDGQFAAFGDLVPYEITVTDPEDGDEIDCEDVTLSLQLGHDDHAHGLGAQQGCSGTVRLQSDGGHGANANIFTSLVATYTDSAQGPANALTGQDDVVLHPKPKQAEFFDSTGRLTGSPAGGDPGVQTETTTDAGGGLNIGFIERGDYVSFERMSLEELTGIRFRVASGGAGGTIEARLDAPDGPVAGSVAVANTGGWQNWTNVTMDLATPPAGTHELFLVFTHPTDNGGLFNVNHFTALGRGAAVSAAPEVTASAEPTGGDAPLQVQFTGTAVDPEGDDLTYLWDFGVAGTTDDTSDELSPTYTYERPGTYLARLTVTDETGMSSQASVQVEVTSSSECPQNNVKSDEFEGDSLDTNRWQIIRPDQTRPPTVSGGNLNFPIDTGSIYEAGTTARNIIVQPLGTGEVEVTAKITTEPLTENYHQAGLRVYQDDNNWASVHMIHAGGNRDFEFIYENNGVARNGTGDKLGGIPADAPLTYWVKLISDGSTLRAEYSYDGEDFDPVGQPANIAGWSAPQVGPVALSGDTATTYPVARFDWIRFNPDSSGGGGGGGGGSETVVFEDAFNGSDVGAGWDVINRNQSLTVSGGALRMPAASGDLYQGDNSAANIVLRDAPASGPWTATAKLNFEALAQYQQAGIIAYGNADNYVKLDRLAHTGAGDEKFEFIQEVNAVATNAAGDSTPNIAANFPDDFWVQLRYDGTNLTGWYSEDGTTYTQAGRAWPLPANARLGLIAMGNQATTGTPPEAAFDSFRITAPGGPSGPSFDDEFDGSSLDKDRWNAIVRDTPAEYEVAGGEFSITTSQGDIYTGDTTPPPNNFILQDASHAGADWTIETRINSASILGEYAQGGLIAYVNGDNYVKFDVISDDNQTRINRIELRSEQGGVIQNPQQNVTIPEANDDGPFYLRLTKAGTNYSGEYSFDGETWTAFPGGPVANTMQSPDFGLFAFSPQVDSVGREVRFDYFWLDGQDPPDECECPPTGGDEFNGATLDEQKWNHIVRPDPTKVALTGGRLELTTVAGDIYTNGDPAPTRNFILQTPTEAGQNWTIETQVDVTQLDSGGYEQGGLLVYQDDDNYIKFDPLSDPGNTDVNRVELRSEVDGQIVTSPADPAIPDGTTNVWLRLTKTGTSYAGEVSFNGTTWTALASPVTNPMVDPSFGIYTLGVQNSGSVVAFDYFALDGNRGECEEPEPDNRAPVIEDATATPQTGFAPLEVEFSVDASDPDVGDTLSYAWDFDGDGDTDSTEQNPTHTYTEEGDYEAEVTVSDGEAERSRTVTVNVFGETDPEARFRVLVFSKTAGFRHDSIDEGHAAIEQLGEENDFQVDHTEDASIFNAAALANYDTVVFLSTTGDVLNAAQQTAFENYIKGGGGYTGIHAAADTEYEWKWYGSLVGAYFLSHPPGTPEADVIVEDADDHTTEHIDGPRWHRTDEWYNYKPVNFEQTGNVDYSPRASGVHVLLKLDESTYDEQDGNATDDDHPISWCQRYDGGRSWYTGMGHTAASFAEADYLQHLLGGLEVSAGVARSEGCDKVDPDAPVVEASATPTSGQAPLVVDFTASATDPNGTAPLGRTAYRWEFGDGSSAFGANQRHRYTEPGTYDAVLTVTDPERKSTDKTIRIIVHPQGGQAPVVEKPVANPGRGTAPLEVRFEAAATDPDGPESQLSYRWDFGDDNGTQFGRVVRHTYMEAGVYDATVRVTDAAGVVTTSESIRITVLNPPGNKPPNTPEAAADPIRGTAPLAVQFSTHPTDPDADTPLTVTWDFGDGSPPATGARPPVHTYTTPGVYTATVTVTDPGGLTATDTVQVTVNPPAGSGGQGVAAPPAAVGDVVEESAAAAPALQVTRSQSVARVVKRGLRFTVACDAACSVTSTLRMAGAGKQRLGKAAARRIGAGDSRRLVLRLDRQVRRNLVAAMRKAKLRNLRATLVLKIRTADGTTTVRKAVVLRR